jgi:hypothetical protein
MGKRELLLLVVFVVLGVGVYQVTAPAAPAEGKGFSIGRMFQFAKAHIQGHQERRTVSRTATLTPAAGVETVVISEIRGAIVVEGTDKAEIEVRLEASLSGIDEEDLAAQEKTLTLEAVNDGKHAAINLEFDHHGNRPRHEMRITVPKHLKVQLTGRATAEVRGVAGLHLESFGGELEVEGLTGPVTGDTERLQADFGPGAVLQFSSHEGRIRADAPREVQMTCERTTIEVVDPTGPVTFTEDYCRMDVRRSGGPIKITGDGGTVELRQITHPLTIQAERLTVSAELESAVPTTIQVEEDNVEVTLPRDGGIDLEAVTTDGDLRAPSDLTVTAHENGSTLKQPLNGGGVPVKLEVTRGWLRLRTRGGAGT